MGVALAACGSAGTPETDTRAAPPSTTPPETAASDGSSSRASTPGEAKSKPRAIAAVQTSVIRDPAGDPGDGNGGVYPDRAELDIRSARLTRTNGDLMLRVRFEGKPGPNSIYVLSYFDADGNAGGVVETRVDADGARTTTSDADFSDVVEIPGPLLAGNTFTLRIPRRYVQPLEVWSVAAATRDEPLEIVDHAPGDGDASDTAEFPG